MDLKKIQTRLKTYEKKFKDPEYRDGSGTRFLMGPYYLLLNDVQGAAAHYQWFSKLFEDSTDEPFHALGWSITELRSCYDDEALYRLRRAHAANVYLIPYILNIPHEEPDIRRFSNWQDADYIHCVREEVLHFCSESDLAWLRSVWEGASFKVFVNKYRSLQVQVSKEDVGPKRSFLFDELRRLTEE